MMGTRAASPFQLADVERPLLAVSSLAAAGNQVILNDHGGGIRNPGGRETRIQRRGGTYILRMWVPDPRPSSSTAAPFTRPGR